MALSTQRQQLFIARLVSMERERPLLYRGRIILLALVAYVYVIALMTGVLIFTSGLIWLIGLLVVHLSSLPPAHILLPLLMLAGGSGMTFLSMMCVYIPTPRGIEVTTEDAAPLMIEIDRLRYELRVGPIHHVLLTEEFNAGISQTPRFGLFGGSRNYLMIGIPLMASLSPEQLRAVIAHELGHISGGHGRFYSWVYQLNVSWFQILAVLEHEKNVSHLLFQIFFHWFAPLFAAYTFPIRRRHEFAADTTSARLVGAEATATALIATHLAARALTEGRNGVLERQTARRWLNDALTQRIEFSDVHPTLKERLQVLGCSPGLPEPVSDTALTHYLGYKAKRLAKEAGAWVIFEGEETAEAEESAPAPVPDPIEKKPTMPYLELPQTWPLSQNVQ